MGQEQHRAFGARSSYAGDDRAAAGVRLEQSRLYPLGPQDFVEVSCGPELVSGRIGRIESEEPTKVTLGLDMGCWPFD